LERCDAKSLPYADHSFAAVISNSIVHHIPQPERVLAEMLRVLQLGGSLFVRDLMRPADEATVQHLVATYAGDANAYQQQMFADSLRAAPDVGRDPPDGSQPRLRFRERAADYRPPLDLAHQTGQLTLLGPLPKAASYPVGSRPFSRVPATDAAAKAQGRILQNIIRLFPVFQPGEVLPQHLSGQTAQTLVGIAQEFVFRRIVPGVHAGNPGLQLRQ
jgi:SAM-dependent methyltransferase